MVEWGWRKGRGVREMVEWGRRKGRGCEGRWSGVGWRGVGGGKGCTTKTELKI